MIVKKIAFGNMDEAYIEKRLQNRTNIIFSNENNRGKTLLLQSLMYSIGYESIFPIGFHHKNYFFYSLIEFNGREYEFLRKKNSILVLHNQELSVLGSISEFKYFLNSEILELPKIEKNGEVRVADLTLLYELFFLGQDKRNTSNLIVKGQNTKVDFINMLYSLGGIEPLINNNYDIENLKKEKEKIVSQIKSEKKKLLILKKNPEIANFVSASSNNFDFQNFSQQLNEVNQSILELKKQRNREENRRIKLENLITELSSLNRTLNEGKVKCNDCGSKNVIFSNDDFEFEVSNDFVRKKIISSIKENIQLKWEIIQEINNTIYKEQKQLNKLLDNTAPETKNYILFQDEIINSRSTDDIIFELQSRLENINFEANKVDKNLENKKIEEKRIIFEILQKMGEYYKLIDTEGILRFENIFTKTDETFSGSEGQEYYFSRLMAISEIIKHDFPIIIDSFREGEISSSKEEKMIQEFVKLNKQIILTSTLKKEEYDTDKYTSLENVNVIDYSNISDSHILDASFNHEFLDILRKFNVSLENK